MIVPRCLISLFSGHASPFEWKLIDRLRIVSCSQISPSQKGHPVNLIECRSGESGDLVSSRRLLAISTFRNLSVYGSSDLESEGSMTPVQRFPVPTVTILAMRAWLASLETIVNIREAYERG